MKIFKAFKSEIKKSTSSTYLKVALVAVILIPLLYGALYLKAFWDPYAKIDKIPVAVVNLDSGDSKNNANIGNDLVAKLKTNDNLAWNFVDANQAAKGMDEKKYYASITIPQDFSSKIYSVDSDKPEKATIIYKSRESTNYLAKTITNRVSSEVASSLSSEVISKYFNNIFVNIKDTSTELQKAADGASQLETGLSTANNGSVQLKNGLVDALSGNSLIVKGLGDLNMNQKSLTSGLNSAVAASDKLKTGASDVQSAQTQIKAGLNTLSTGLTNLQTATNQSQAGANQAAAIINAYIANHPESSGDLTPAYQALLATSSGLTQTSAGIAQVNGKLNDAATALDTTNQGQSQIVSGLQTMQQSLQTAANGSTQLADGSAKLTSGATKLDNGLSSLYSGASALQSGLNEAETGTIQLRDKLSSGATKVADNVSGDKISNETNVMSAPISTSDNSYNSVANYGSGLSPYFITLALWVGGLMSFFVIDFDKKPKNKTTVIVKYMVLCIIGVLQSVILGLVLILGLGLKPENVWQFYAFTILISLSYMAILQLLIHHFGNVGRYIAIILLVLQLTSAAGTFPKETLPLFFQIINPLLPMTYAISGLRDILFTHELSNLVIPVLYLIGIAVVSITTNLILASRKNSKKPKKII